MSGANICTDCTYFTARGECGYATKCSKDYLWIMKTDTDCFCFSDKNKHMHEYRHGRVKINVSTHNARADVQTFVDNNLMATVILTEDKRSRTLNIQTHKVRGHGLFEVNFEKKKLQILQMAISVDGDTTVFPSEANIHW